MNQAWVDLVKRFEGLVLSAYQDVAGIWTIGYGHTLGVRPGMVWTEEQAEAQLLRDIYGTELTVSAFSASPNQHAAMTSLAYNIGTGAFLHSSALRRHRAGEFAEAAADFLLWDKAHVDGELVEVAGLLNRRKAESELYLT